MSGWKFVRNGAAVSLGGDRILLALRDATPLVSTFPPGCIITKEWQGTTFVVMPLKHDTLRVLRNLGYNTRGLECLIHQWTAPLVEGVHAPMPHQLATAGFLTENERAFCTSTMRTGKTASAIIAADYLIQTGRARGVLIICTVSTMRGVWDKEVAGMLPRARVSVLYGSRDARRKALEAEADYYVINYDGLKVMRQELLDAVDAGRIDVCIIDELTHYAKATTERWAVADEVINGKRYERYTTATGRKGRRAGTPGTAIKWVWGLTGTPGGPEGIFGQIKLVNPTNMNMSFTAWRDMVMVKLNQFKWIPSHNHKDMIALHMQPCIRFDKKDIMDLPPVVYQHRDCDLSAAQQKVYKHLKREMLLEMEDGLEVQAANKAALVSKLLQVSCGVVRGTGGNAELDMTPRLSVLEEVIAESQTKVVIFAAFTAVLDVLHAQLSKKHRVGLVDGRVTGAKRDAVFSGFQRNNEYDVLLCHPQTTAFGVELSAADTIVFFGPPMSGEFVYQQAVERLSSLSQKADQIGIVHMTATSEERKLFKAIKEGVDVNEAINDIFSALTKN